MRYFVKENLNGGTDVYTEYDVLNELTRNGEIVSAVDDEINIEYWVIKNKANEILRNW